MSPGIYAGMSSAEYHARPELSNTLAQILIEQSPLHAWTASPSLNPNYKRVEKEEFDIGLACHALLLEGQDRMAVIEAEDWRTKVAQKARAEARAAGKHPVLAHRYQDVLKMRDVAVRAITECKAMNGLSLLTGQSEIVIIFEDIDGAMCRARLDHLWSESGALTVLDYKSTADATPRAFSRQIARMGYHYQDEFYSRAVEAQFGRRPNFIFLAQEPRPPYACSFHACGASLAAVARSEMDRAVGIWNRCKKSNRWPAHDSELHIAEAMPWQIAETEERIGIPYEVEQLFERRVMNEDAPAWP